MASERRPQRGYHSRAEHGTASQPILSVPGLPRSGPTIVVNFATVGSDSVDIQQAVWEEIELIRRRLKLSKLLVA
jgi:hypothetical protein